MLNTIVGIGASFFASKLMSGMQDQKVKIIHATAGRVRLQCDKWKNEQTSKNLENVFRHNPIVKEVKASPITGSLLLVFHLKTLTPEQFDYIVKSAVETSIATYPELQSDLLSILKNVVKTLDTTMKKQSGGKVDVDSLLSVILIINGVLRIPTNPAFSSSLLYWAYTLITNKK
ncbi:hypothetical protein P9265_06280 [Schinkia azotoformans]|uniref:HMA2 domain-containing protein n=1 Tax=Schinkia azotoformans TaxID=1454 RepID=UPI002E1A3466|nr:hypothetical protein [Schinkia azotoformans]